MTKAKIMKNFKVNIIDIEGKKTTTTINHTIVSYYRYVFATPEQKQNCNDMEWDCAYVRDLEQTLLNSVVLYVIEQYDYASKHLIEFELIHRINIKGYQDGRGVKE